MIQSTDLVSVIIPVYNVEKYLDRCLQSVVSQDYPNIEIVLVDDGSTDASPTICDNWVDRYLHKIRVIHQKNQGASFARKNGIQAAKGQYLTFVDSDDYVLPQYVSMLYRAARENHTKVAVCGFHKTVPTYARVEINVEDCAIKILSSRQLFKRFFKYEFWGFWGGIYHKSLFYNTIYPQATINEDYFVKAQIFSKVDYIGYCTQPLYIYENHPESLSKQRLSLKALGEFDNTVATWKFIKTYKPQYTSQALAIASEAACKWLGAINRAKAQRESAIEKYKYKIKDFVRDNFFQIIFNRQLLWKIRIVLLWNFLR